MVLLSLKNKKVLLTGHTGFKGSWMCALLHHYGAKVYGYSLKPPTCPSLYDIANIGDLVTSEIGDICDFDHLSQYYKDVSPDFVIHMAAQPIVRVGYKSPRETYNSNVMGTVNILECTRLYGCKSFLNVTTDKVYRNIETEKLYQEGDPLDGYDPYSNSKSCSELVTGCYRRSFFSDNRCAISTARAGNVIGGGDFADDRIIPDCMRAALSKKDIILRNPNSVRPYQHVLEPLFAYLTILTEQYNDRSKAGSYNIGPNRDDCITTGELATSFCKYWGNDLKWISQNCIGPHEANFLKLNNNLLKNVFGYAPRWHIDKALEMTVDWIKSWQNNCDVLSLMEEQMCAYCKSETL